VTYDLYDSMEPKVIAAISSVAGEANGNAASVPYISAALRDDPSVYPTSEVFKRLHPDKPWPAEMTREVARAWTRIQTGQ
jgi:putrescine transport system substrate-binding protein